MGDPFSLNGYISDHEGGVFSFLTTQLVDNRLSPSPIWPTRLSSALGSHLESDQDIIMGRVPTWGSSVGPSVAPQPLAEVRLGKG